MKKKLYIDLDDTLLDTEYYIRLILQLRGTRIPTLKYDTVYELTGRSNEEVKEFKEIIRLVFEDYDAIPLKVGAKECLPLLETEYDVIFCSTYHTNDERRAKKRWADKFGKELILCGGKQWDKSHVNMKNSIFIDDSLDILIKSNADYKIQMYNPYKFHSSDEHPICSKRDLLVTDWYQITDHLMEVNVNEDIRRRFCKGIQEFSFGSRV